ncbi:hypothetical protein [Nocardioides humi]|uniref:LPXTG-motif cell wall anchor domain-containing protein n=1 Tax=Nocardioides humi TaxID=449461 RepID=A0ABN2AZE3_9ACTN|nr:hypothetical protein [Nocardioides humi]
MRRYLVLWGAVAAPAALLLALAGVGSSAAADPYTPAVPTSCRITVPTAVVGDRAVVRVRVTAAGNVQPTGNVTVEIDRVAARQAARSAAGWSKTVRYDGATVEILGPRLTAGVHRARATFVPDDPVQFARCRDSAQVRVGSDETGGGGPLPNTGGPHLAVLLAGIGLVVTGGGLVERGRRRA